MGAVWSTKYTKLEYNNCRPCPQRRVEDLRAQLAERESNVKAPEERSAIAEGELEAERSRSAQATQAVRSACIQKQMIAQCVQCKCCIVHDERTQEGTICARHYRHVGGLRHMVCRHAYRKLKPRRQSIRWLACGLRHSMLAKKLLRSWTLRAMRQIAAQHRTLRKQAWPTIRSGFAITEGAGIVWHTRRAKYHLQNGCLTRCLSASAIPSAPCNTNHSLHLTIATQQATCTVAGHKQIPEEERATATAAHTQVTGKLEGMEAQLTQARIALDSEVAARTELAAAHQRAQALLAQAQVLSSAGPWACLEALASWHNNRCCFTNYTSRPATSK